MAAPSFSLNDGRQIPQVGFGVWQIAESEAARVVGEAISAGYRLIDTATIYGNERGVGQALREAAVPPSDLFVTTKLWNDAHGRDAALRAFDESLARLQLDRVDLYLIHWPAPQRGAYVETWRALTELKSQGRARSIGVSNFTVEHLEKIIGETGVVPAINQIELHPRWPQDALRDFHRRHGIVTQSWSPLGQGQLIGDATVAAVASKMRRTPAQVLLRWHLQLGLLAIPKSEKLTRIRENLQVFDFSLDEADMKALSSLKDPRGRIGPDPETADF